MEKPSEVEHWFSPKWPNGPEDPGVAQVCITERRLGHVRVFYLDEQGLAKMPWIGLALMYRDGTLSRENAGMFSAALLLSSVRHKLREYRAPLSGLRECYRDDGHESFVRSLWGSRRDAAEAFYRNSDGEVARGVEQFRRRLFDTLPMGTGSALDFPLPVGVAGLFRLPARYEDYEEAVGRIFTSLGRHLVGSAFRHKRGPRIKSWLRWAEDAVSHSAKLPLNASREELACAVAYGTWFAQTGCYPAGMVEFAKGLRPGLEKDDALLFRWMHMPNPLLGVPIHCWPEDYHDFIWAVMGEVLAGKTNLKAARDRVVHVLGLHGAIRDENQEQDRDRKREVVKRQRRDAMIREDQGRTAGKPR